ncbi:hypothetical protein PV326_011768, partial [Microctonus aethiopoides]
NSDVVEVKRGLETLINSCIAGGDGKNEYLKTVTFVNLHSNCRKNYTNNNLSIRAFKRRQEEPSTSVSPRKKKSVLLFSMQWKTFSIAILIFSSNGRPVSPFPLTNTKFEKHLP